MLSRKQDDGTVDRWAKWKLNEQAKVVCAKCNNEWMSALEDRTRAVINQMAIHNRPQSLDAPDLRLIAANTFKGAVVADLMHDHRPPFFSLSQRRRFAAKLDIPDGIQMWLASMTTAHGLFKSYYFTTKTGTPGGFEFNVFTYGLGHFVVQLSAARWKKKAHRRHANPPRLTQSHFWDSMSIPFWPDYTVHTSWPPPQHLPDEIVDQFVMRFGNISRNPSTYGYVK